MGVFKVDNSVGIVLDNFHRRERFERVLFSCFSLSPHYCHGSWLVRRVHGELCHYPPLMWLQWTSHIDPKTQLMEWVISSLLIRS